MTYTYDTYTQALCTLMVTSTADSNFVAIEPSIIAYAENRIYRELDLLDAEVTTTNATFTNDRFINLTQTPMPVVVKYINLFTPAGTTASNGTRNTIVPASRQTIDMLWPNGSTVTGIPQMFAMSSPVLVNLGPAADNIYNVEVVMTVHPTPLSSTNTTTILTTYVPDLFMAASMVFASGYMRNFGSQADNAQMAQSWEGQYQILKGSASIETMRQRFAGWAWTGDSVSPVANVKRA